MVLKILSYTFTLKYEKNCGETNLAVLPPLKVHRHIQIILTLLLIFTKDLKERHVIEINS